MNKFISGFGMVVALASPILGQSCDSAGGPTSYQVKSIGAPWVEDNNPATVPNGCPGDGKTWAVVYYTSKGGSRVTVKDPQTGQDVPVVKTSCVNEGRAKGLKVGGPYIP